MRRRPLCISCAIFNFKLNALPIGQPLWADSLQRGLSYYYSYILYRGSHSRWESPYQAPGGRGPKLPMPTGVRVSGSRARASPGQEIGPAGVRRRRGSGSKREIQVRPLPAAPRPKVPSSAPPARRRLSGATVRGSRGSRRSACRSRMRVLATLGTVTPKRPASMLASIGVTVTGTQT
jgi:hypothetical protein